MDIMDIATLSRNMAQDNIMREVNLSLMRNMFEQTEQTGEIVTDLIHSIPMPDGTGAMLDILI